MTRLHLRPQAQARVPGSRTAVSLGALGSAAVAGSLAGVAEHLVLPVLAVLVVAAIALRPQFGAYLYLIFAPLIAGIPRGVVAPFIRPSEGLLILIITAWFTRIFVDGLRGRLPRLAFDRVQLALALLAFTASVPPLLLRFGRDLPISTDDVLYALVLWKFLFVYCLFRHAVTTAAQVQVCLWLATSSSAMVGLVAIMQVLGLFGIPELLWAYYDRPFEGILGPITHRGTSTMASSFAMADMMVMSLAIALAWLPAVHGPRRVALGMAVGVSVLGCIASAQFSAVIGLGVAVLTIGVVTGWALRLLLALIPAALAGLVFFWPLIELRLSSFRSLAGLPPSWAARLDNLERFVWPELTSGLNWVVGVRPSARIAAPEPWRDWVYIESGYAWVLWTGGLPMLAAFTWFVWTAFRSLAPSLHSEQEPTRIAAAAATVGLATIVTLMLFDPHLTMRGSADLFFALLALSFVKQPRRSPEASLA
ncbi:MAG: hypothetical protein ACRC67_43415 [Inquilinus sp.]|uniref:hypothetical protein n=1 Tax=Inquilinus sp. TaxID=1932117 RepID=UPI003F2DD5E5